MSYTLILSPLRILHALKADIIIMRLLLLGWVLWCTLRETLKGWNEKGQANNCTMKAANSKYNWLKYKWTLNKLWIPFHVFHSYSILREQDFVISSQLCLMAYFSIENKDYSTWNLFFYVSSSAFVFSMPSIMIMVLKQLIYLALNMLSLIWLLVGPEAFLCLPRPLLPCPIPPPLPPKKHKAKSPLSFSFAKQLRESILFSASPFQVFSPFLLE